MSRIRSYFAVFLLLVSSVVGLFTIFVYLPDTVSAETNPPTTAKNWDDISVDPTGRSVYNNGVGMDWSWNISGPGGNKALFGAMINFTFEERASIPWN